MKQIIVTPMKDGEYAEDRAREVFDRLLALRSELDCTVSLVSVSPPPRIDGKAGMPIR